MTIVRALNVNSTTDAYLLEKISDQADDAYLRAESDTYAEGYAAAVRDLADMLRGEILPFGDPAVRTFETFVPTVHTVGVRGTAAVCTCGFLEQRHAAAFAQLAAHAHGDATGHDSGRA